MTEPSAPLPVTLLTGFLGSGKSTVLNFVLRLPGMQGTAVVINEYGEVGLDHHLVEAAEEDTTLIADGCICCTARGRIDDALSGLLERARRAGSPPIRRVIVETTGLAEPGPIMSQLVHSGQLAGRFVLDSVVTLVDALNHPHTVAEIDIAQQQVAAADRLLISKLDLLEPEAEPRLRTALAALNPDAEIHVVRFGEARMEWLFGGGRHQLDATDYQPGAWLAAADRFRFIPESAPPQPGLGARSSPAEQDIQTFSLILDEPLDPGRVRSWLDFMRTLCGPTLLRVKGLIHIRGESGPLVVHGVQRAFHPPVQRSGWPDADQRTRLVFITRGWGQDVVASTLAFLRTPGKNP